MSARNAPIFQLTCYYSIVLLLATLQSATVEGFNLGLISPIEVVEEWGCYDSEIRLTCGHLDSKIAILEAIFTPNCTDDDCYRIDFRRLMRARVTAKRTDPHLAETEAGRRFLETLRKTDFIDDDLGDYLDDERETPHKNKERINDGGGHRGDSSPRADFLISHKKKRTSLRASLERLIIKYLKKLSPDIDINYELQRRRSLRVRKDLAAAETKSRIELGARNITLSKSDLSYYNMRNGDKRYKKLLVNRSLCMQQRKKVTSLDRFDIEKAMRNETKKVHNIRSTLNRRCSGRNHCSFLFAVDYPYALLWNNGSVYVKYICMEAFRANKYCGEHLIIGNEISQEHFIREKKGEPIAEARQQPREQGFHSLKIIKTSEQVEDASVERTSRQRDGRKRRPKFQQIKAEQPQGVYSQDFKVLKILPSNLDDVKDIKKFGNEIYFHKEVSPNTLTTQQEVEVTTPAARILTSSVLPVVESPDNELNHQEISPTENITIIIREGEEYVLTFPKDSIPEPINATEGLPTTFTTEDDITTIPWEGSGLLSSTFETEESPLDELTDYVTESGTPEYETIANEIETIPRRKFVPERKDRVYESSQLNSSHVIQHTTRKQIYNSTQRTLQRDPLLQGFAMTPGYPKFYVGDMECKWQISAPAGQRIRITLLDLSLRYDAVCKDFLEIVDLELQRTLFNSCNETVRPVGIISDTNRVEIKMKALTKFAYPKRGILLHYSALGCLTPNPPQNGRLVERTEYIALFECDAGYVFPDTSVSSRRLECEGNHEWNNSLPDCIDSSSTAD